MTDVFPNQIVIAFPSSDVGETKNDLVKAFSAAFRWRAAYKEEFENDDYYLSLLAQMLEQIADA